MTQYVDLNDIELINGCLKNDRKAQEQLYRKYANEMFGLCLAYESDRDQAKDVLQDAFIKVFRSLKNYNHKGSLKGWIRRVIVNTAIDHFRKKGDQSRFIELEQVQHEVQEQKNVLDDYNETDILFHVKKLPEKAKLVFNLFALEGFSHKEIAQKLEITEGTSKSQFNRARMLLQQNIKAS